MPNYSTPAIMLRRIDFGDYDLIITFFTLNKGKTSVIAKSAKKSTKRFSGILELFSILQIVITTGGGKGLPVLQETTLKHPHSNIRTDIKKTGYASYWAELINEWTEESVKQVQLYRLFEHVLGELDLGHIPDAVLSIIFQMRFASLSGHCPDLKQCNVCRAPLESILTSKLEFDIQRGGLICGNCVSSRPGSLFLTKGSLKQLLWTEKGDLTQAGRIRFTPQTLKESLEFLETFVPYYLGKEPRSLKFLREIRN
jgi:DNA repair protein RecO (recombination protein O)